MCWIPVFTGTTEGMISGIDTAYSKQAKGPTVIDLRHLLYKVYIDCVKYLYSLLPACGLSLAWKDRGRIDEPPGDTLRRARVPCSSGTAVISE
jgi:hypothetical protein